MNKKFLAIGVVSALIGAAALTGAPAHAADEPEHSYAYHMNWKPVEGVDTCSKELHDSYSVVGSDGKLYPTWHPAQVTDPATGKQCTFGHEHGDDPKTSNIYGWVTDFLKNPKWPDRTGIPFGIAGEASMVSHDDSNDTTGHRHEDNTGHKVVVANNVKMVTENPRGYLKANIGGKQQIVTCDFLMALHMGTHSADAFKNNAHELFYAVKCNDGTAMITTTLSRLGNPNEYNRSCEPATKVTTSGATAGLPQGEGGSRRIPDRTCVDKHILVPEGQRSDMWGMYEVWETVNNLRTADNKTLASFDPWLAVRNPSRFYDGDPAKYATTLSQRWATQTGTDAKPEKAREWPFSLIKEDASPDQKSVDSPFNGARHDYYLKSSTVTNSGGATTWYTDAYGQNAKTEAGPNTIKQYISASDNSSWPALERRNFGLDKDYGAPGTGVHAPN